MTKKRSRMANNATVTMSKSTMVQSTPLATSPVPSHPPPSNAAASSGKKKKKKNKKKMSNNIASSSHHVSHHCEKDITHDDVWQVTNSAEERQKIREFWLQLGEEDRRSLVKVEKEAVLRKMKEQQKNSCNCSVCGKKRTAIEDELDVLYDAYYEELEHYANTQQNPQLYGPSGLHRFPAPLYDGKFHDDDDDDDDDDDQFDDIDDDDDDEDDEDLLDDDDEVYLDDYDRFDIAMMEDDDDLDEDDDLEQVSDLSGEDDYSDSYDEEDMESFDPDFMGNNLARLTHATDSLNFGNSLTVKGGILTVADDLLKNDGKKFIDMMERIAERRMQRNEEVFPDQDDEDDEDDEYFDEDEDDDDDDDIEQEMRTDEQRMRAGRKMFQIFAARMFEQRVHEAYREKVARERQQRLLEELEEEDRQRQERELKKQKDKEKKKDKKRQLKQQQEEERKAKEAQKQQEEARKRQEHERKLAVERERRESERLKKEEAKRQRDLERLKKEEEKRQRQREEKERMAAKERERKAKEDALRKEREHKAQEEADRKAKEEAKRKAKQDELDRKAKQVEAERRARQEADRKAKQDLERKKLTSPPPGFTPANPSTSPARSSLPATSSSPATPSNSTRLPSSDEAKRHQVLMDALLGSSSSTSSSTTTNAPLPPPHPLLSSAPSNGANLFSTSTTANSLFHPSLMDSLSAPLVPPPTSILTHPTATTSSSLPPRSSPSLPSLTSAQPLPLSSSLHDPSTSSALPPPASSKSTFASSLLLSPPSSHARLPPPNPTTMDVFATGRRPSISALSQLHISDTTPPPVAPPPGVTIPSQHNRRSSAMAGPIGSPVSSRFGFDHFDSGNASTAPTNGLAASGENSFFSNFLFGDPNRANSNMMQPFNEPDLLGPSRLDMDRRFSIETPPFNNWRPNGWPASSLLPDANRFGDNMTQTDRHAQLVERAKVAYQKLDEITQAKYFLGGASSTQHTLTQLHRMMSDLYFDTTVDTRELYDVLAQSSMFQCIQHPQQGILVRLEIPTSSAPDDPLRRTSLLQSALHPSAPVHSPASHPSLSNASMLPQTSSPPFSFQPSLSTSLNYSFKNDR